ncbi:hypothetical protein FBU31_006526, partial [Coemansia sp. 'formosensis']
MFAEPKRQGPGKRPPGSASAAQRGGGPRKDGKIAVAAAAFLAGEEDRVGDVLGDGDVVRGTVGSFLVKPRGNKGGRRGPGQRDPELSPASDMADDISESTCVTSVGPRPVYCTCRRSATPGETMLACTDCKELFHGSCIDVSSNTMCTKPLYVCEACLQQHPRKRRAPGTILGVGSKVAPLVAATLKRSKKAQTATAVDPMPKAETSLAETSNADMTPLPMANQAALEAFMNAAGAMDEDDICPICEDECTCRGGGQAGGAGDDNGGGDEVGAPMPLFSQISRHTGSISIEPLLSSGGATKRGVRVVKKPVGKAEMGITKARTTKIKAAGKPRAKKGKNSEKSLISRLVSAMDGAPPTDKVEEEEL